jgi:hypothetical protein
LRSEEVGVDVPDVVPEEVVLTPEEAVGVEDCENDVATLAVAGGWRVKIALAGVVGEVGREMDPRDGEPAAEAGAEGAGEPPAPSMYVMNPCMI